MNAPSRTLIALFLCFTSHAYGGTRFESWDAYTDRQTGKSRHGYRILNTKRGIFLGPCGFGTRSIQWEYWIDLDLSASQQLFQARQIKLEDDNRKAVPVISGTIVISPDKRTATLNLQINRQGRVTDFEGNGKHRIQPY
jgi:hypothetical protein